MRRLVLVFAILCGVAAMGAWPGNGAAQTLSRPEAPTTYTHPQRGYTVVVPPGAEMTEGERQDVIIQARTGYRITVQSAGHTAGDTLQAMLGRLEAIHLGEGKTWNRKLDSAEATVGGFPAVTATYEGGQTRTQVVLVRAADVDLVFMFFAAPTNFDALHAEFRWFLDRVKPAARPPAAPTASAPAVAAPVPAPAPTASAAAPAGASPPAADAVSQWSVFAEPGLGYRVSYPPGWVLYRVSDSAIVIGGPEGSEAYAVTVGIQNVVPPRSDKMNAVAAVTGDLKSKLAALPQSRAVQEGSYGHVSAGAALDGQQFTTQFSDGKQMVTQWTVVIPHDTGASPVVHVWTYRAPVVAFDSYRKLAGSILGSLTFAVAKR